MDNSTLSRELLQTAKALSSTLQSLSDAQIDEVPFEGSWTAGQVGEHIFKSLAGLPQLLHGATAPAGRAPDQLVPTLREIFLDYSTKLKSPDFILPTEPVHDRAALAQQLEDALTRTAEAAASLDMSALCLDADFPGQGKMTRLEWCTFALVHTQRHVHQLHKIADALTA